MPIEDEDLKVLFEKWNPLLKDSFDEVLDVDDVARAVKIMNAQVRFFRNFSLFFRFFQMSHRPITSCLIL